jgi:hypothetical protein
MNQCALPHIEHSGWGATTCCCGFAGTSVAKLVVTDAPVAPTLRKSTYQKVQTDEWKRQFSVPRKPSVKKEKEAAPVLTMVRILSVFCQAVCQGDGGQCEKKSHAY